MLFLKLFEQPFVIFRTVMQAKSTESVISLKDVSKQFGHLMAVHNLNLEVMAGDVFGFLGPNGAGKSTTMRMMLSLIAPTSGKIKLFGLDLTDNRNQVLRRVGSIIEKPDFYLYLSARKNLELFARLHGLQPEKKLVDEMLELVGLSGRGDDKVKAYSHGMKQRLGLAQTLMHDPELIILDEPTTGLDPQGIIDIRKLILHLSKDLRKTIFLSSHILSEVELIANRMAIINKGKTLAQGEVATLLSNQSLVVSIEVSNPEVAIKLFSNKDNLKQEGNVIKVNCTKERIPQLLSELSAEGIDVFSLSYKRTLEEYFLKLMQQDD